MRFVLDKLALSDLDGIHAWIAKDSPANADTTIDGILAEIEHLGRLPHLGHRGRARDTLEWVLTVSPHVIVYEIDHDRDELIVTGVFRSSQQIRK